MPVSPDKTSVSPDKTSGSLNLAVVCGRLSSEPRLRELPTGSRLLHLEITVEQPDRRADSVPVTVFDPSPTALRLAAGADVVVTGSVRRRFFRAGGSTVSRTEVVADTVATRGRRSSIRRAIDRVRAALDLLADS